MFPGNLPNTIHYGKLSSSLGMHKNSFDFMGRNVEKSRQLSNVSRNSTRRSYIQTGKAMTTDRSPIEKRNLMQGG